VGLGLGIPAENPPLRPRLPLKMIWQIDQYQDPSPEELPHSIELMNETLRQEGYYEPKYGSKDEYLWSIHMFRKFWAKNMEKLERKEKEDLQRQGFLEKL
jgi:hypothetical protein